MKERDLNTQLCKPPLRWRLFSMRSPRAIFEQIPFARRTIKELSRDGSLPHGVKIFPRLDMAAMGGIFPDILAKSKRFRSILLLVGKENLPNSVEFVLPEEFEAQKVTMLKRSRGAMVTFQRRCSETLYDLIFTIYIDKSYCPEASGLAPDTERLMKRAETFAMEFLNVVAAYRELRYELHRGDTGSVVPNDHAQFDDAFELLCSDEEILRVARKFCGQPKVSLKDVLDFFASDYTSGNQESLMPKFWDYWQYERRVRAHLVAKRIRQMLLVVTNDPNYTPRRPISEKARALFE